MLEVLIDKSFEGPGILEIASLIGGYEKDYAVKVSWLNTRNEIAILRSFPERKFILVVDDLPAKDRVTATLGLPLSQPQDALDRAHHSLVEVKAYDWRGFCGDCKKGLNPKWLLLKLVADSLRKGKTPALAEIMPPLLLDSIKLEDVDILLRLKARSRLYVVKV